MNIKILGPGCSNCRVLFQNTQEALKSLEMSADLEKVEDHVIAKSFEEYTAFAKEKKLIEE